MTVEVIPELYVAIGKRDALHVIQGHQFLGLALLSVTYYFNFKLIKLSINIGIMLQSNIFFANFYVSPYLFQGSRFIIT